MYSRTAASRIAISPGEGKKDYDRREPSSAAEIDRETRAR